MWHTLIISLVLVWYQHNRKLYSVQCVIHITQLRIIAAVQGQILIVCTEVPSAPSISLYLSYKQPPPLRLLAIYNGQLDYEGVKAQVVI